MSRSRDRLVGRLPEQLQIVHGYLDEALDAPVVTGGLLVPTEATLSIWAFDSTGVWSDTGRNVEVTNMDESWDLATETYVVAWLSVLDGRWYIMTASCSASALPFGGS